MAGFLVEFRLQGYAKKYARWVSACTLREAKKRGLKELKQPRFVSHITLFGPARTNNLRRVIAEVERIGWKYTLIPFKLGGFDKFRNPKANWLYLSVHPSSDLEQFRYELAQSLCRLEMMISNTCETYDHKPKFKFHSSIGKYDPRDNDKFEKLSDFAENKCSFEIFKQHKASVFGRLLNIIKKYIFKVEEDDLGINLHLLRVTILGRRNRIQSEYDLILKRSLNRRQALDRLWGRITIAKLRVLLGLTQDVFFISDTHFDHHNIISYCDRRFSNTKEMNRTIKRNWNSVVGQKDTVYFLGDWSFGRKARQSKYWMEQLYGYIFPIRGSHDRDKFSSEFSKSELLRANGHTFLLIHDPEDEETIKTIKEKYDWIIHGHVHNNKMDRYPFINGEQKTINVSSELINYRPVSINYLLSLNLDSIRKMRTVDSEPERW